MNVGERVATVLGDVGIDALFGVPGGQTLPLYQATRAAGLRHVVTRDERSAACAADAYARVSGTVGVCDATVGPGVTNLVSGLAEAQASSIPVLALVADIRTDQEHLRRRSVVSQALDQRSVLAPVTKWVARVEHARSLDDVLDQALRVATSGRPGPVALEVPEDVWLDEAHEVRAPGPGDARAPRQRIGAEPEALDRAAELLADATRPVLLAGGGVVASDAAAELRALAGAHGIPVVTTVNAKGVVDERAGASGGVVGLFGAPRAVHLLDTADVVVVVGSKLDQFSTHGWRMPHPGQRVVHVDVDGEELGRTGPAEVVVAADARVALEGLRERLAGPLHVEPTWPHAWEDEAPPPPPDGGIHPAEVCRALDERLEAPDVVVCDASYASGWAARGMRVSEPRHFVAPRGLAGIGWSPGAALGARLAAPEGRVVVVAGDGGFAYGVAEIETAARLGLQITYVVLNNSALAWIVHGEDRMGIEERSTFRDVDFAAVARGFGGVGWRVSDVDDLDDALARALATPGPCLVDVVTSAEVSPIVSLRDVRARAAGSGASPR